MARLVSLLLTLVLTINFVSAQSAKSPFLVGEKAPTLTFNDFDGNSISLEHLRGNVMVLNLWNIGCSGCELERETLNWLSDSLKQQPIKFVSITLNKKEKIANWLAKHPINYEFVGNIDFMGLSGPSFFNCRCMPTTVVIDRTGMVRYKQCKPIIGQSEGRKFAAMLNSY